MVVFHQLRASMISFPNEFITHLGDHQYGCYSSHNIPRYAVIWHDRMTSSALLVEQTITYIFGPVLRRVYIICRLRQPDLWFWYVSHAYSLVFAYWRPPNMWPSWCKRIEYSHNKADLCGLPGLLKICWLSVYNHNRVVLCARQQETAYHLWLLGISYTFLLYRLEDIYISKTWLESIFQTQFSLLLTPAYSTEEEKMTVQSEWVYISCNLPIFTLFYVWYLLSVGMFVLPWEKAIFSSSI